MENQKSANYGQDSHTAEKQPWTPDYHKTNLHENAINEQDPTTEELDKESGIYSTNNRNLLDSISASDTENDEYVGNLDEEDYVHNSDDEDEDDEDDDELIDEDFEEERDFQEKDIDYREKKERDSF